MKPQRRALLFLVGGLAGVSCGGTTAPQAAPAVRIADAAVQVIADGCSTVDTHGAGLMVAAGRVATVAHVVAGATKINVRGTNGITPATVVYFDPVYDVAVLKVDPGLATPIPIGTAAAGDRGTVIVYRDDAPVELTVGVLRRVDIRTADIYGEGVHLRPGYEINVAIRAGDSGATVVVGGKAVALMWATSRLAEGRAWAMRTSLIADHLSLDTEVDNGQCI
jgi:S1-C subfamily serine protease